VGAFGQIEIIHFIDLKKTPRTAYSGTKHIAKKTGSPIVNRRSRPQTAQALMVRTTVGLCYHSKGVRKVGLLTFCKCDSHHEQPSGNLKADLASGYGRIWQNLIWKRLRVGHTRKNLHIDLLYSVAIESMNGRYLVT
jgi:hypothetical protein